MSCKHPLKGFRVGTNSDTGKSVMKIVSYETDHLEQFTSGGAWYPIESSFISPSASNIRTEFVEIPCGHCVGCRLDYSKQWAARCVLEATYHESNYFLTLTYDNDHVPYNDYYDDEVGVQERKSLRKSDLQKFFKRLRDRVGYESIRYFACGEYGSNTYRPHYHIICFGLRLDDLKFYKFQRGYAYYTSEFLNSVWPFGFVVVGEVTYETCAYTARYVLKKAYGEDTVFFENIGCEPEFTVMSRKPGIAFQYLQDHPEIYDYDRVVMALPNGSLDCKPPRYYDRLFDIENHDELVKIKENRQIASKLSKDAKLSQTDLSYLELLQVEEDEMIRKINILKKRGVDDA